MADSFRLRVGYHANLRKWLAHQDHFLFTASKG
jgi:hypothetical protein